MESLRLILLRDVTTEIKILPRSHLCDLEDQMPLPLGCDESMLTHMKKSTRTIYLFFLAETSLKAIANRINMMAHENIPLGEIEAASLVVAPIRLELKKQLIVWEHNIPKSLGWVQEPATRQCSALATRLKLIFWLARFWLCKPLILRLMDNMRSEFNVSVWNSLVEGLLAGCNVVKVMILEESQVDAIMGRR